MVLHTCFGALKKDKYNSDNAVITDFTIPNLITTMKHRCWQRRRK